MLLTAQAGVRGTVYDLDTGKRVPKVMELNVEQGYVRAYHVVEQDDAHPEREVIQRDTLGEAEWYEASGRFRFVPAPLLVAPCAGRQDSLSSCSARKPDLLGALNCTRCKSPLTLPGDDLCPRCRAADRGQRNRFVVERLTTPLLDRKCSCCYRLAVWSVADEVEVSPQKGSGEEKEMLWERGMTVGRRYYCDGCYRPARLLDPKGEVMRELRYAGPDVVGGSKVSA